MAADKLTVQQALAVNNRGGNLLAPEQRRGYIEEGGAFHLDGYFTVFGQVLEGMDVVEKISREAYDVYNRPVKDVVIKRIVILDK